MQKFLNSEEIVVPAGGEDTGKRLPSRRVFAARAERLHQLAKGHAMEDFLAFAARLADAQQNVLDRHGHAFQDRKSVV